MDLALILSVAAIAISIVNFWTLKRSTRARAMRAALDGLARDGGGTGLRRDEKIWGGSGSSTDDAPAGLYDVTHRHKD